MEKLLLSRVLFYALAFNVMAPLSAAHASTLPRADFGTESVLGLGGGQSVGLSVDTPLNTHWAMGLALGLRAFVGARAEFRAMYRLEDSVLRAPYQLAGLVGAQAKGPSFDKLEQIAPLIGIVGAFQPFPNWLLRATIAGAYPSDEIWRASGLEIAYRYNSRLELTVGYNGRGDVLGIKLTL
ncbi:MAG: hypothetical protein VKN33_02805 [Candidatus Sericytochromatia bacterium]|nr:hypothetical protein [Candidatus Sericytochromatia bacterium]